MRYLVAAIIIYTVTCVWATGCTPSHTMGIHERTDQPAGHVLQCQKCYDQVVETVRKVHRFKGRTRAVVKKHMCSDCNTEAVIYGENNTLMFQCARCVPEGVPCDLCRPPATTSQPGASSPRSQSK